LRVSPDPAYDKLTGSSTAESLLSGAVIGAACEADGMIRRYADAHSDLQVVITGGDAAYLCKQLKSRFFAHQNLLLQGLHAILRYNL
jgi:type III pantothenate kinase